VVVILIRTINFACHRCGVLLKVSRKAADLADQVQALKSTPLPAASAPLADAVLDTAVIEHAVHDWGSSLNTGRDRVFHSRVLEQDVMSSSEISVPSSDSERADAPSEASVA